MLAFSCALTSEQSGADRLGCKNRRRLVGNDGAHRQPTKRSTEARAASYASVECRLRSPPPRWTLPYQGMNAVTASTATWSAGVVAA